MGGHNYPMGFDYSYDTKISPFFSILLLTQRIKNLKFLRIAYVSCNFSRFQDVGRNQNTELRFYPCNNRDFVSPLYPY
jgi:hypothetical protein